MVKQVKADSFDSFMNAVKGNDGKDIFIMFTGSAGEDGKSWCPDCVAAVPALEEGLTCAAEDSVYIYCAIERPLWKDQANAFRTTDNVRVKCLPTLMKWGQPQRLEEGQCSDKNLVKMFFEED